MPVEIEFISFGNLHDDPPGVDVLFDLSGRMRDPHTDPAIRELTGADPVIVAKVKASPGAVAIVHAIVAAAQAMRVDGRLTRVGIACAGGRHRSYVMAVWAAELVDAHTAPGVARVTHRHAHLPVVRR